MTTSTFAPSEAQGSLTGVTVDLREIGDGETASVFLGFDPETLSQQVAAGWKSNYQTALGRLTVEAGDFGETLYGRGL